jgi:hypothetical protein
MRLPLTEFARTLGGAAVRGLVRLGGRCLGAMRAAAPITFHVAVIAVSAGTALSLPSLISLLAQDLLVYWTLIENEKFFLTSLEIVVATALMILLHAIRSWAADRRLAKAAREAGIVRVTSARPLLTWRWNRRLRERHSVGKDIMLIGSTGFRTFARPDGNLHTAIQQARHARILLLNPESDGARRRAQAILNPEMTLERLAAQVRESLAFLKQLKATQKDVRVKLYSHPPFLKLAILGDYAWLQHYHAGLDVSEMPEFVFKYDQAPERLYVVLYQYFLQLWNDPEIPEYDLTADVLVYRDADGNEVTRLPVRWNSDPQESPPSPPAPPGESDLRSPLAADRLPVAGYRGSVPRGRFPVPGFRPPT